MQGQFGLGFQQGCFWASKPADTAPKRSLFERDGSLCHPQVSAPFPFLGLLRTGPEGLWLVRHLEYVSLVKRREDVVVPNLPWGWYQLVKDLRMVRCL